jgi:uncharacterized protein (TIGR00251 family)
VADQPSWCRRTADGWTIAIHAQPGARRTEIVGQHGDRLKVRVAAPALEDRANAALIAFAAERLGITRSKVTLVRGAHARDKLLAVPPDCDPMRLIV